MKKIIFSTIAVISLLSIFSGCTKDFAEMNTDPHALINLNNEQYAGMYLQAERYIYTGASYQVFEGLHTDLFSQFYAVCVTSFTSDRYVFNTSWVNSRITHVLINGGPSLVNIMAHYDENTAEYALAKVMWVYGMHHLTDFFGAAPYVGACAGKVVDWLDCKTVYHMMIEDLDKSITTLKSADKTLFAGTDRIFNGDLKKWAKFAASMKLRLGMRLVNKEPDFAKTTCEAAFAAGVLTGDEESALFTTRAGGDDYNQGNVIGRNAGWNEFAMSSAMLSYLGGYNDPRLGIYFQPAIMTDTFHSIRNGMSTVEMNNQENQGPWNSNVGERWLTYTGTPKQQSVYTEHADEKFVIMPVSEVYFLRAEGALRGWNMGGNAKDLYNEGIRKSMKQWGVPSADAETYLNGTTDPSAPNDSFNSPAVTTNLPVKYKDGAGLEYNLQQIITQKWLGLYGGPSPEAWAEVRRTGYPVLYPILHSDNELFPEGSGKTIQREKFSNELKSQSPQGYASAVAAVGGVDQEDVKIYWAK